MEFAKFSVLLLIFLLCETSNAGWFTRRRRRSSPSPVHCQMHNWSNWGSCSNQCGHGKQFRERKIKVYPAHGGNACPPTKGYKDCATPVKPCLVQWSSWSTCSKSCDRGSQTRGYKILQHPQGSCSRCPPNEQKPCNTHICECVLSSWTPWSRCTKTCDSGSTYRTREITSYPQKGAPPCRLLREDKKCNIEPCPCELSDWSSWGECSTTCGPGSKIKTRRVIKYPSPNGKLCEELTHRTSCNMGNCSVDCEVSDWGVFTPCSRPCGEGTKTRYRTIRIKDEFGGARCPVLEEIHSCNLHECKDCILSGWSNWLDCSKSCDAGSRKRSRTVLQQPDEGGDECSHLEESENCNTHGCPCEVSDWGRWGICSKECGDGKHTRTRTVVSPPSPGGKECPVLFEDKGCKNKECTIDCKVGEWSDFAKCSKTCGQGVMQRTREVLQEPLYGGDPCPDRSEPKHCMLEECQKCQVSSWGRWWKCKKYGKTVCESNGIQLRQRKIKSTANREDCPDLRQQRKCTGGPCPANCNVSQWSSWSKCKAECGKTGKRYRRRTVEPEHGARDCPHWKDSEFCVGSC